MAKICSKEKTEPQADRDSVQEHFSQSSVSEEGTDTALLEMLSPTSEEGKQHIKPWKLSKAQQRTRERRGTERFLVHLGTRLGLRGEQGEQEMLLSRGPTFGSQQSQAGDRKHREQIYTMSIRIPSATSLLQRATSSFHTSAGQRGDYAIIRGCLGPWVSIFSFLWGSGMGEERAKKKSRKEGGEVYETGLRAHAGCLITTVLWFCPSGVQRRDVRIILQEICSCFHSQCWSGPSKGRSESKCG